LRFAQIYGAGAAMGFTPQQVGDMSMWQFMAAADGYAKAHGAEDSEKPSDEFLDWALGD